MVENLLWDKSLLTVHISSKKEYIQLKNRFRDEINLNLMPQTDQITQ